MIAKFTGTEDGKRELMRIWLEGNRQAHDFISEEYWLSHFDQVGEALSSADVFICQEEGKLRGFAGMTGDYLAGIFVDSRCRCQGTGRALLNAVKEKYSAFTLQVYVKNRRAVDFYLREGLSVVKKMIDLDTGQWEYLMLWAADPSERLYRTATAVVGLMNLGECGEAGQVACAAESEDGRIYTGVCIDLPCSLGFCAEQAAAAQMLRDGQTKIKRIVAVTEEGSILPPCGRCREFLYQIDEGNLDAIVMLPGKREARLKELLPERWNEVSV